MSVKYLKIDEHLYTSDEIAVWFDICPWKESVLSLVLLNLFFFYKLTEEFYGTGYYKQDLDLHLQNNP